MLKTLGINRSLQPISGFVSSLLQVTVHTGIQSEKCNELQFSLRLVYLVVAMLCVARNKRSI